MALQRHMHGQHKIHASAVQQPFFPFLPQQHPHRQKDTQKHRMIAAPTADAKIVMVDVQSARLVV